MPRTRSFIALGALVAALATTAPASAYTSTISGTVTDEAGRPVAGLCVERFSGSNPFPTRTETDALGGYRYTVLAGRYFLYFTDCGWFPAGRTHAPEWYGDAYEWKDATPIVIGHLETRVADTRIGTGATVTGSVSSAGEPVEGICATGRPTQYRYGDGPYLHLSDPSARGRSDASGAYRMSGNLPGTHRVYFSDCREESYSYVSAYYPNAALWQDATDLSLSDGEIRSGIDFEAVLGATVTGVVRGPSGEVMETACISAIDVEGNPRASTDQWGGSYRLQGVPPDDARIHFSPCSYNESETIDEEYHPGVRSPAAATHLAVGGGQTMVIDASLTRCEASPDIDGDGLTTCEEVELGTSIWDVDSDYDGLGDWDEVRRFRTDPTDSDTDGDAFRDGTEVNGREDCLGQRLEGGSDPLDASSTPVHPAGAGIGVLPGPLAPAGC